MEEKTTPPWIGTRKVYQIGDGGLAVLLPPSWARSKDVDEESEVIVVADNRVVIEPYSRKRIAEIHDLADKFAESKGKEGQSLRRSKK